jgi:hypothetical protein
MEKTVEEIRLENGWLIEALLPSITNGGSTYNIAMKLYRGTPARDLTDKEKSELIFVLTGCGYKIEEVCLHLGVCK